MIHGVRLTVNTYHRLMGGLCSTCISTSLPEEFRQWNRLELEQAAQRKLATRGEGSSSGLHGNAALSSAPLSETRRVEVSDEADDVEADASHAEAESPADAEFEEGNETKSGSQAGHKASGAESAESRLHSSEADYAERRSEVDDDSPTQTTLKL
eukprot:6205956-Pleurochrysis_carterae.AAC.1